MGWLTDSISAYIQRRPAIMRTLTGLPQRINPIFSLGSTTVVLKASDVREVLKRTDCFELGPVARDKMLMGDFLLGLDSWTIYEEDKAVLISILDDFSDRFLETLAPKYAEAQRRYLDTLVDGERKVDLVADYVEPIVTRFSMKFFLGLEDIPDFRSEVVSHGGRPAAGSRIIDRSDKPAPSDGGRWAASREEYVLAQWLRKIGSVVAVGSPASFGLQEVGEACAGEFQTWLDAYCRDRLAAVRSGRGGNCILDWLLTAFAKDSDSAPTPGIPDSERDAEIIARARRNIAGLMLAGTVPIIKSFVHLTDQLLLRSDPFSEEFEQRLRQAIKEPNCASDASEAEGAIADVEEILECTPNLGALVDCLKYPGRGKEARPPLWAVQMLALARPNHTRAAAINRTAERLILEAWRFNTTFPALLRYCPRKESIAAESDDLTEIPARSTVIVSPLSAMNDRELFPNPDKFEFLRPQEAYMHFGYGGHECLGKRIATVVLRELILHLAPLLPRAGHDESRIEYDGPAIEKFEVDLEFVCDLAKIGTASQDSPSDIVLTEAS